MSEWRPRASLDVQRRRAALYNDIREFFNRRDFLEVETPLLAGAGVTEPNLRNLTTQLDSGPCAGGSRAYLQTSPEYAMKRMLAAGSGAIFQICKAFRDEELGALHQPEFTMLEWYRPGFDHRQLMDEVDEFLQGTAGFPQSERRSYAEVFSMFADFDPHAISDAALRARVAERGMLEDAEHASRDDLLDLVLSVEIAPGLGNERPCFVYDYPVSQAALARLSEGPGQVAQRFELFVNGLELANGFYELTDAEEQRRRFEADNRRRRDRNLAEVPIDAHLLAALEHGLPDCSGVALGLDRLLMLLTGSADIADVLVFPVGR
jgi:lysyl-tRNA synthetase class 2